MKIDSAISVLESALLPDLRLVSAKWPSVRSEVFSHRHAAEFHALGITCEFDSSAREFPLLLLRVVISTLTSDSIKGDVRWFRSRADLGVEDASLSIPGLGEGSLREFQSRWPSLLRALEDAIDRGVPLFFHASKG